MKKHFLRKILPTVFLGGILAFAISIGNMYYGGLNNNQVYADTLDNPSSTDVWFNVGGMFNERGFSSSNSFSYDENEIINNFNGNLQYSFPLYSFDGPGDLDFNMSLNYNGAMAHTLIAADSNEAQNTLVSLPQHNMNLPGWVFSVNGMAVQTLNFETHYFTKKDGNGEAVNKNVNLHSVGYQLTDRRNMAIGKDYINLLMGDGTVLKLENLVDGQGTQLDTGNYYSVNRKDFTKAKVLYNEPPIPNSEDYCRNRVIILTRGDGLVFHYYERKPRYKDSDNSRCMDIPQVIRLEKISDRFGNNLWLEYDDGLDKFGRSPLKYIHFNNWNNTPPIKFEYTPSIIGDVGQVKLINAENGDFRINTTGFYFNTGGSNSDDRAQVTSIVDPYNESFTFEYASYNRTSQNIAYNTSGDDFDVVLNNGHLKRLSKVTNKNGGERLYTYKGNTNLTLDLTVSGPNIGVHSNDFWGQGRDAFFNNMVEKVEYKTGASPFKKIEYSYYFNDPESDFLQHPVDADDNYETEKWEINLTTDTNATPSKLGTKYFYKNYIIFNLTSYMMENYDFPGETHLIKEEHKKGEPETTVKTVEYFADIVENGGFYNLSSFRDTLVKETINGAVKETRSQYEFFSNYPFSGASKSNPVKKITSIDPFKNKKVVEYEKMDGISKHYARANYSVDTTSYETPFYHLGLSKYEELYDSLNNLTGKSTFSYIWGNNTDSGYIGQLVGTKILDPGNANIFKEIRNEYYKKDTVGKWLYIGTTLSKPGIEGNIKKTIDAKGNIANFYYHPISQTEGTFLGATQERDQFGFIPDTLDNPLSDPPIIAYIKAYENGTDSTSGAPWQDSRRPTRVDVFTSPTNSLKDYNIYTKSGNLLANVNNNSFLSVFAYDSLNRITHAAAPHDLSPFNIVTVTDTIIEDVVIDEIPHLLGAYDYVEDEFYAKNMSDDTSSSNWFRSFFNIFTENDYIEEEIITKRLPLIGFPSSQFSEFISIDSAFLTIHPYRLFRQHSSTTSDTSINDVRLIVRALDSFNVSGQLVVNPNSSNQHLVHLPQDAPDPICTTSVYQEKKLDISDLMELHLITQGKPFAGFELDLTYNGFIPVYTKYFMHLAENVYPACVTFQDWKESFAPRIKIYGKRRNIRTYNLNELSNANYMVEYADDSNKVRTLTKLSVGNFKKNENIFDGFYRLTQSKMYTDAINFNSSMTEYNYINKPSKTIDARNIETKFSYDEFGNVKKTENPADTSESLMSSSFQNGLTYHWGTVPGIINKQEFTDEVGNKFVKFFDAVGNLRRELKFRDIISGGTGPVLDSLKTDYRYDSLYRVTHVKTPNSKIISYKYDAFGRQKERTTVDAGTEQFRYDKNDNMRFSMDAVQSTPNDFTFRGYDGINRLLYIGKGNLTFESTRYNWEDLNPDTTYSIEKYSISPNNFLTVNVYDTLSTSVASGLFSPPSDYYSTRNNTKGKLIATAYRTRTSDPWNFKYYRYDGKGRVLKMWSVLDGLGTKVMDYIYNSSDQVAFLTYQYNVGGEFKKFRYQYDGAGRLATVDYFDPTVPDDSTDALGLYKTFASYTYNENSMVDTFKYNQGNFVARNEYNNRNWLSKIDDITPNNMFNEILTYNKNGNVNVMSVGGTYNSNMSEPGTITAQYTYDKSNRLLTVDHSTPSGDKWDISNTYDGEGNLLTLERYDSKENLEDDFNYVYYSGTNKLARVSGSTTQFEYDANGNVTTDILSDIHGMKYDHRNLMTEYNYVQSENYNAVTRMWYDEAGYRIRKVTVLNFSGPGGGHIPNWDSLETFPPYDPEVEPPIGDGGEQQDNWQLVSDEWYVRDLNGKEIALYNGTDLKQWNIGKEGKIDADSKRYFFLKDHLGTIRAIIDTSNAIVQAKDVDMWGYRMLDREYSSSTTDNDYFFTGKERDREKSGYDYFGARYLSNRIGRWTAVDPLAHEFKFITPYNYALNNPLSLIDEEGMSPGNPRNEYYESTGEVEWWKKGTWADPRTPKQIVAEETSVVTEGIENAISLKEQGKYISAALEFYYTVSIVAPSAGLTIIDPKGYYFWPVDFATPLGLGKKGLQGLRYIPKLGIKGNAAIFKEVLVKSRFDLGYGVLDFVGKGHTVKLKGIPKFIVETPHIHPRYWDYVPPKLTLPRFGEYNKVGIFHSRINYEATRPATEHDFQEVIKLMEHFKHNTQF